LRSLRANCPVAIAVVVAFFFVVVDGERFAVVVDELEVVDDFDALTPTAWPLLLNAR
jgi:hypothetical protein